MAEAQRHQDVLGQFPLLKSYHHVVALFPLNDSTTTYESVVESLETGLGKLVAEIPWLADQVINEGKEPGNSGVFKLASWPSDSPPNTLLRVKDCSKLLPSYVEIIKARGPISMLDGNIICPFPGFPLSYDEAKIGPAPVIMLQANFVTGGLLLNFSFQHNILDMTGLFAFMSYLSAAMRDIEIPARSLEQVNRDRTKVVPLFGPEDGPIRDHSHLIIPKPAPLSTSEPVSEPTSGKGDKSPSEVDIGKWVFFHILPSKVTEIKALASTASSNTSTETNDVAAVPFISTNDALCAFYWKRICAVRLQNGQSPSAKSKFSRAIDGRQAMGVSREYMGQLVYFAATFLPLQEVVDLSLPALTHKLRADLNDVNNSFSVRSYATFLAGVKDKGTLAYGGPFNRELDIGSSSGSLAPLALNFGPVLGAPDLLRRPKLAPLLGCLYFFPTENKYLPMLVCLKSKDLEGLRKDPEWSQCTEFIG
jgi:hypothetical protein